MNTDIMNRWNRVKATVEASQREMAEIRGELKAADAELKKMGIDPKTLPETISKLKKTQKEIEKTLEEMISKFERVIDEHPDTDTAEDN